MDEFQEGCLKLVETGIIANKFHYSSDKNDQCSIFLSNNLKFIYWQYSKENSHVTSKNSSKIFYNFTFLALISEIEGIIYGALTSTFLKY